MSKIIFTNGCFDILHPGHIELFKVCRNLAGPGGRVIIGLDSDAKIKKDKGIDRPINTFLDRKAILDAIKYIDVVHEFDTNKELENLIELYSPDILLDGGDWREGGVGREYAKETRFFDRIGNYSSTRIIQRIKSIGSD
tara:strand:- start:6819 stop:7235 length:417 start_codon:yes stop_codon:yes gene_type:complete